MVQTFNAATGELVDSSLNLPEVNVINVSMDKQVLPFCLNHDGTINFYYDPATMIKQMQPANSQPILIEKCNFDTLAINERVASIVEECNKITEVTKSRLSLCNDRSTKQSMIHLANDTLLNHVNNVLLNQYISIVDDAQNMVNQAKSAIAPKGTEEHNNFVGNLCPQTMMDHLRQIKISKTQDLAAALQLDDEAIKQIVNTVKSLNTMLSIQEQCKSSCQKALVGFFNSEDLDSVELKEDLETITQSVSLQEKKLEEITRGYTIAKGTGDELQLEDFEITALGLYSEILDLDKKISELESFYYAKDYQTREKSIRQMVALCGTRIIGLLVNSMTYFTKTKAGGVLERAVFIYKLPSIYAELANEAHRRKEIFNEDSLVHDFRNFTEMVRLTCMNENEKRSHVEDDLLGSLAPNQVHELSSIIPGIIGERVPVDAIINGLNKLERSIVRTVHINLPTFEKVEEDDDDFVVLPDNNEQSPAIDMSASVLFEKTEEELDNLGNLQTLISPIKFSEHTPSTLNDSIIVLPQSNSAELESKINDLTREIESLKMVLADTEKHLDVERQKHLEEKDALSETVNNLTQAIEMNNDNSERMASKLRENLVQAQGENSDMQTELLKLREELSQVHHNKSDLEQEVLDLREKFAAVQSHGSNMDGELKSTQQELIATYERVELLEKELAIVKMEKEELSKGIAEQTTLLQSELASREESIKQLQEVIQQTDVMKKNLQEKLLSIASTVNSLQNQVESKQKTIEGLEASHKKLIHENEILCLKQNEDKEQAHMEYLVTARRLEEELEKIEELEKELASSRRENEELKERLANSELQTARVVQESESLGTTVTELKKQIQYLDEENKKLVESVKVSTKQRETTTQQLENSQKELMETRKKLEATVLQLETSRKELETSNMTCAKLRKEQEDLNNQITILRNKPVSPVVTPQSSVNTKEIDDLKEKLRVMTNMRDIYMKTAQNSASVVTDVEEKLKRERDEHDKLKELYNLIQDEYVQLQRAYQQTLSEMQQNNPSKTLVAIEPTLNDTALFFRSRQNKDLFEAFTRGQDHICLAPDAVNHLKQTYGSTFDQRSVVIGKIVYMEPSSTEYNPFNLQTPYVISYIDQVQL